MIVERLRSYTVSVALLAGVIAGCDQPQTQATDSSAIAPAVDSEVAAAPATPAPAQPESHIGKMPVLDPAGSGGACTVEPLADPRIRLVTPYPTRQITVEVGDSTRAFRPVMLEITMSRPTGAEEEKEIAYATFDATGRVKVGTREYRTSGASSISERARFSAEDTTAARQLALQVVELCRAELQSLNRGAPKP